MTDQLADCPCSWCQRPIGSYAPLTGKQKRSAALAEDEGNVWEGAVRSAKTISSLVKWTQFARTDIRGDFALIGITQDTIRRNLIGPLQELYGAKRVTFSRGSGEMMLVGRRVHVLSANNESDVKKIKGLTLASFYGDELSEWPEAVYNMSISRLSIDGARWYGTTNPGGPNHWLLKGTLIKAQGGITRDGIEWSLPLTADRLRVHRFSFRLTDNPFLPEGYVDRINRQYTGLWRKRLIDGEWCQAEGAVYAMFEPARHVVSALPEMVEYFAVGIDYGTTNPTSAILLGLGVDGVLYAVREWRYDSKASHAQLSDEEYSRHIRAWLDRLDVQPTYICVDPSAASFRVQLWRDGLSPRPAVNSVTDGIRLVSSLFTADKLKIHESCEGLIEELPSYAWDDRASAKGLDVPMKVNDHSCDALRYGVATTQMAWHRFVFGR